MTTAARKVFSLSTLLAALFFLAEPSARAQSVRVDDYDAPVRAGAQATYLDLLRKVFPDIAADAAAEPTARTTVPLRHLFGDYRRKVFRGEMKVEGVDALPVKSAGREHLLLLVHVGGDGGELFQWGEAAVLALFRLGPSAELLDAADVQADRFTGFWEERPRLPLAASEDAAIVANSHHNAGQAYLSLTLVGVERGRLKTVFDLPGLLSEQQCGRSFNETPSVAPLKSRRGDARHRILVKVVLDTGVNEDAGCTERARRSARTFKTTLVWNPRRRRYESRGGNLARLSRFNEKNY